MPVIDRKFRDMAFQGPNIGFLPDGLAWVKDAGDNSCKVFYLGDYIMRLEKVYGKLFYVQPFVWRTF